MGGTNPAITIPAVQVSQADGATIKAGLPATSSVQSSATPDRSCHDTGVILGSVNLAMILAYPLFSVGGTLLYKDSTHLSNDGSNERTVGFE